MNKPHQLSLAHAREQDVRTVANPFDNGCKLKAVFIAAMRSVRFGSRTSMLIDASALPKGHVVEANVCIIGSGPAGISLAREFMGQTITVCLLESGGLAVDPQAQALSEAMTTGDPFLSPQITRHRQLGGNANIWAIKIGNGQMGLRYAPLDEIDFEPRDWLPHSGWAFSRSHLDPFYQRAQTVCQAGEFDY